MASGEEAASSTTAGEEDPDSYEEWATLAAAEMDAKAKPPGALGTLELWAIK